MLWETEVEKSNVGGARTPACGQTQGSCRGHIWRASFWHRWVCEAKHYLVEEAGQAVRGQVEGGGLDHQAEEYEVRTAGTGLFQHNMIEADFQKAPLQP